MDEYLLKIEGEVVATVGYDSKNHLRSIVLANDLSSIQLKFILYEFATNPDNKAVAYLMKKLKHAGKKFEVIEVPRDLSFNTFWDTYNYKKGNKKRVERKWNALEDSDKVAALAYIKKYNFFLAENPHIQRKFAETYLNHAEWRS